MSVDAIIKRAVVRESEDMCDLYLVGRDGKQTTPVCVSIVQPTWTPEEGLEIWGGLATLVIESRPARYYQRSGQAGLVLTEVEDRRKNDRLMSFNRRHERQ